MPPHSGPPIHRIRTGQPEAAGCARPIACAFVPGEYTEHGRGCVSPISVSQPASLCLRPFLRPSLSRPSHPTGANHPPHPLWLPPSSRIVRPPPAPTAQKPQDAHSVSVLPIASASEPAAHSRKGQNACVTISSSFLRHFVLARRVVPVSVSFTRPPQARTRVAQCPNIKSTSHGTMPSVPSLPPPQLHVLERAPPGRRQSATILSAGPCAGVLSHKSIHTAH